MALPISPAPIENEEFRSYPWKEWFRRVSDVLRTTTAKPFSSPVGAAQSVQIGDIVFVSIQLPASVTVPSTLPLPLPTTGFGSGVILDTVTKLKLQDILISPTGIRVSSFTTVNPSIITGTYFV
jgi:hypothetical protein